MKLNFGHIIFILALSVAACAGYFSVLGLSQLFAGASMAVLIFASFLEVGKIGATTALHRYWTKLTFMLKFYVTISVIVLMGITSTGIYGFLSNAYQKTANKVEIYDAEVSVLAAKQKLFEDRILDNDKIIDRKNKRIDQLVGLRVIQENRLDSAYYNSTKNKIREDIKIANTEVQSLSSEIDTLTSKNTLLSDSIAAYAMKILELSANNEISGEIGPLKFISALTNEPMDKVVNIMILLIIFVFDPFAIALVLMANKILEIESQKASDHLDVVPVKKNENLDSDVDTGINIDDDTPIDETLEVEKVPYEPYLDESDFEITEEGTKPIETSHKKLKREDIKEVKQRNERAPVQPQQPSNSISRIGANKIVKDGDAGKVIFKR